MNTMTKVFLSPAYLLMAMIENTINLRFKKSKRTYFYISLTIWLAEFVILTTLPLGIGMILSLFFVMSIMMGMSIIEG